MPIMERHTDTVHPHAAALPTRGSPVAASPSVALSHAEEMTPTPAPEEPYSSTCSSSPWLSSLFFPLWAMNNENKNEKASSMTVNYCLCD